VTWTPSRARRPEADLHHRKLSYLSNWARRGRGLPREQQAAPSSTTGIASANGSTLIATRTTRPTAGQRVLLAWPYGSPNVYSGYEFTNTDPGPEQAGTVNACTPTAGSSSTPGRKSPTCRLPQRRRRHGRHNLVVQRQQRDRLQPRRQGLRCHQQNHLPQPHLHHVPGAATTATSAPRTPTPSPPTAPSPPPSAPTTRSPSTGRACPKTPAGALCPQSPDRFEYSALAVMKPKMRGDGLDRDADRACRRAGDEHDAPSLMRADDCRE